MMHRSMSKLAMSVLIVLVISSISFAFAANIVVPSTRLTDQRLVVAIHDLAPAECSSISSLLTAVVVCTGGSCSGSTAAELILGTAGDDQIDGKNGSDCILGGSGNDSLNGGNDDDVLIGNDGDDVLDAGPKKDTDVCYGGTGSNSFVECDVTP